MNSTKKLENRYSRFIVLPSVGVEGLEKIKNSRATIVGCGGLGSASAIQLTTLGIGYLRIIDNDLVELSNLQRQLLYRKKDVGKLKVEVAKKFLQELNPDVEIEAVRKEITPTNISIVSKSVDFVIDAVDNFSIRLALNKECLSKDIPFLFGAVSGFCGNSMTIKRDSTCLECVFNHVDDDKLLSTIVTGIHPAIIQIIGCMQVAEATKLMLGQRPSLLNRLLFCDLAIMQFDSIIVKPRENCMCSNYKKLEKRI